MWGFSSGSLKSVEYSIYWHYTQVHLLYTHIINMLIYTYIYRFMHMQNTYSCRKNHNDTMIKDERRHLKKNISLTLFVMFACERELETEQNCNILTPTLMAVSVVFLVLKGCSTGGPGAQLSAGWWLSLLHLITNWSPKLHRGSQGPLRPGVAFPTTSCLRRLWSPTVWLPVLTELYNSSMPTQSPTQSLEWHVCSSSSRNNCHAVQRSLSSGASVYECIMSFYLVPFRQLNPPTRFLSITGHWNVSLPSGASLWSGMFAWAEGQYITHPDPEV